MAKFKSGDVVIVKKPEIVTQWPSWTNQMNRFDGGTFTINKLIDDTVDEVYSLKMEDDYWFLHSWLTLIDPEPFEGNV